MIRPYSENDREALLEILKLNTPHYFDPSEEQDFSEYLDQHLESYFIVEVDGKVIGSGGINYFEKDALARLSWDLVHPDFQNQGVGRALTLFRIAEIKKNPTMQLIIVRTTQLVYPFYQKLGFKLEKTEQDYWAKGLDLYQMELELHATALSEQNQ